MNGGSFEAVKALFAPTHEQLMWRVQMHDDAQAFAELVRHWEGPIQRLCLRLTGDAHRSEDLAQEVFVRLFARRKAYQPARKFSSYLWRIALNLCYDELRRGRHRRELPLETDSDSPAHSEEAFASDAPSPSEEATRQECGAAVRQAVLQLPEDYRSVVVLRHYEGLKFREIAEVLDLPEGTVKTRMTEALSQLARALKSALDLQFNLAAGRRARPSEMLLV